MSWTGMHKRVYTTSPSPPPPPPPPLVDLIHSRRSAKRRNVSRCGSPRDKAWPFEARHKRSVVLTLAAVSPESGGATWAQLDDANLSASRTSMVCGKSDGIASSLVETPAQNCLLHRSNQSLLDAPGATKQAGASALWKL